MTEIKFTQVEYHRVAVARELVITAECIEDMGMSVEHFTEHLVDPNLTEGRDIFIELVYGYADLIDSSETWDGHTHDENDYDIIGVSSDVV
jgi:hypothetical protein|tara:strand:+ start:3003 stop:3275 length:273 start_codon:yes stop_codon:yes gene_type:complete